MWKLVVLGCLVATALARTVPEEGQVFYKLSPEESGGRNIIQIYILIDEI